MGTGDPSTTMEAVKSFTGYLPCHDTLDCKLIYKYNAEEKILFVSLNSDFGESSLY